MSFSRRRMLKAAGYFVAGVAATNAKKVVAFDTLSSQTPTIAKTDATTQIAMASQSGWAEKILNSDGTINWTEYVNVANNYDQPDIIDYRLGPDYSFYHSTSENISKLWGPTTDGLIGYKSNILSGGKAGSTGWFAMSGQLVFLPDESAPAEYKPGVARARNGSFYEFRNNTPDYCFDMRVQWTPDAGNYYNHVPDFAVTQQNWKDASSGSIPAPPIATVRTKGKCAVTGFLIFKNGLVGVSATGNDGYNSEAYSGRLGYTFVKLGAGKVPTAAAVTPNNEFLLVTTWDTIKRKGEVAVIAIQGPIVASGGKKGKPAWGFPNWPTVTGMKLLGYVDLPFAAPTAIQVSTDHVYETGRDQSDNANLDLNSQTERDTWYNWGGDKYRKYKRTARCGYAVVISRAENKATFIDLQPLLQYYRKMYFTTQANYDRTKSEGTASDQWPYTFSYAPEQKPQVVSTISVNKPTAVAAGLPQFTYWRDGNQTFQENTYIATMDGELRMYKVGNLITTDSGGTVGDPFNIVKIGKNPTSIDYGRGSYFGNDLFINCRGDKTIYYLYYNGSIHATLRDSRLQDPVYVAVSYNRGYGYYANILTVMDFKGKQVVNYRFENGKVAGDKKVPVGNPPNSSVFEYGYATPLPGKPFMYSLTEVI